VLALFESAQLAPDKNMPSRSENLDPTDEACVVDVPRGMPVNYNIPDPWAIRCPVIKVVLK
jgi:hypothetical protein